MMPDETGACVCADPDADFDPYLGTCQCAYPYHAEYDQYTGTSSGRPQRCWDPIAIKDVATGECVCPWGWKLGDTLETTSAACVPFTCGDAVCQSSRALDVLHRLRLVPVGRRCGHLRRAAVRRWWKRQWRRQRKRQWKRRRKRQRCRADRRCLCLMGIASPYCQYY